MLPAVLLALAAAVTTAACGSSSSTSTGPSPAKCQVSLDVSPKSFTAGGTRGTVSVTTQAECAWTAASQAAWLSDLVPASGQGTGEFTFQVPANPVPAARQGEIDVNGTRVSVSQEAAACVYALTPAAQSVGAGGGAATAVAVATTSGCAWTAVSAVPWITVTSGATGNGNGAVGFTVAGNTGAQRTGTLTIAGQTFTVTQGAAGCAYTIAPISQSIGPGGGAGSPITVTTTATCAWTAVSGVPWITITSPPAGTGNGSVGFSVSANPGAERTGTLTIGDQTFTVTQAAAAAPACAYTIAPNTQSFAAGGGAGTSIGVTTTGACAWTAVSNAPWVTVTSGASGSGNGTVGFSVAANSGSARNGTLTIAGQTFTVTQAAVGVTCTYAINPNTQSIGASGGAGTTVTVTTPANCAWGAVSGAPWITVAPPSVPSGTGTVGFTVGVNTGAQRTGTLTIAGQTFTVTQAAGAAPCSYNINSSSQSVAAAGGNGSVNVTTTAPCAWTAVTNSPPWLTVTSGASGSGNGAVGFNVAANSGPERTGTLTIATRTFTVTQASGCSYSIAPTSQAVGLLGGTGSVAVTTAAGCGWTVVNNTSGPAWITVTSGGGGGSGNGTVGFSVAANALPRNGTLTIAGQTFTVMQRVVP
jgi:hypothetical protein